MFRTKLALFLVASMGLCVGCDDELPDPLQYGSITGTVFYDGTVPETFEYPGVSVSAFTSFPPMGAPHGTVTVESVEFGVDYTLGLLPEHDAYYVLATLVDVGKMADLSEPAGGFPNVCALFGPGNVVAVGAEPTTGVDITMFDNGGMSDPCFANPGTGTAGLCPTPGKATLAIDFTSTAAVAADDVLRVALFSSWPPAGPPVGFYSASAPAWPTTVADTDLSSGDYAVYVCFDRGGNNPMECGAEDIQVVYQNGALVPFRDNRISQLKVDLDAGSSEMPETINPDDVGCNQ